MASEVVAFAAGASKATLEAVRTVNPRGLAHLVTRDTVAHKPPLGDLTGGLAVERGHITFTQPRSMDSMAISAQTPLIKWGDDAERSKSRAGGQGSNRLAFAHDVQAIDGPKPNAPAPSPPAILLKIDDFCHTRSGGNAVASRSLHH